jgi:predicted ester cyclase
MSPTDTHPGATRATIDLDTAVQRCVEGIHAMARGDRTVLDRVIHPAATNREAADEPPACREPGPAGFHATAAWLRRAFEGLTFEVHDAIAQGDVVAVHVTMRGRQTGVMVMHGPDGEVVEAFPPKGREFATTQTHWFRMADGLVVEHWANRDDIGTGKQLGWIPPSPGYLVRMARAKRRERRAARRGASRA